MTKNNPPSPQELQLMLKMRKMAFVTFALFGLWMPVCFVAHKFFPSASTGIAIGYIVVLAIVGGYTTSVRCPRCGDSLHFRSPFRSVHHLEVSYYPLGSCQNLECDLRLRH